MNVFISIAIMLAGALVFASLIKRLEFPEVSAFLLLGIFLGPHSLNLVAEHIYDLSDPISLLALGIIAFMLGEELSLKNLEKTGKTILWISLFETVGVCVVVTSAIYFILHQPFYLAILLGAIATATDPAATMLVVRQYRAKGTFTNTLLGIVAIDDVWGIITFAVCLSIAELAYAPAAYTGILSSEVIHPLIEIPASLILGAVVALVLSRAAHYVSGGANLLVLILSSIFLLIGVCLSLDLSVLLANVALGVTVVNVDGNPKRFFDALRNAASPIFIMFFVLAGAHFDIKAFMALGGVGLAYIICRTAGKMLSALPGGYIAGADSNVKKYMGLALLPQAGVALGMALVAKKEFPHAADTIFTVAVATTVIFEILGPICTRYALSKAGEIEST
ncbi:MAG: cation:proton antiporter [Planctomycetota bacterium]|jgi:NhaP-type Na+/H+ or K+/H+ antiporter